VDNPAFPLTWNATRRADSRGGRLTNWAISAKLRKTQTKHFVSQQRDRARKRDKAREKERDERVPEFCSHVTRERPKASQSPISIAPTESSGHFGEPARSLAPEEGGEEAASTESSDAESDMDKGLLGGDCGSHPWSEADDDCARDDVLHELKLSISEGHTLSGSAARATYFVMEQERQSNGSFVQSFSQATNQAGYVPLEPSDRHDPSLFEEHISPTDKGITSKVPPHTRLRWIPPLDCASPRGASSWRPSEERIHRHRESSTISSSPTPTNATDHRPQRLSPLECAPVHGIVPLDEPPHHEAWPSRCALPHEPDGLRDRLGLAFHQHHGRTAVEHLGVVDAGLAHQAGESIPIAAAGNQL
jgi:hypothetical protein